MNLEHIGIAVRSLDKSIPLFEKLFNSKCYKLEEVKTEQVVTAFFEIGETKIELLESTSPSGVISSFIERKGEGVHHIAFEVADIHSKVARLKNEGFVVVNETPKPGADDKIICFIHPKSTNGILVELCQSTPGSIRKVSPI